ncbi:MULTISPECIES: DMT family transporter [unclassified Streptococcus]|uniref:DMT family transporter n=1 Tax=unclassified Streptococcus TaxID=2608887 RepID=UPI001072591B|nr:MULTISPECIES: DMT family transporter [unclassified Streptococcus]MBF0805699.1 DMT family transporter [Streptococcus sp. 19428wA2_WM07]TFU28787.1 DMT family transporter [Streptococcus sp. WM07]
MKNQKQRIVQGTLYGIISGIVWGLCGIIGQYFFSHYMVETGWITSMRLLIGGVVLLTLAYVQDPAGLWRIWRDSKMLPRFFAYTILGLFSVQFFFYLCIQYSNAATATILQFTAPVFILLYTGLWKKHPVSSKSILYVLLTLLGVILLVSEGDLSQLSISPMALMAGLLSAVGILFNTTLPTHFMSHFGSLYTLGWGLLVAGIFSNFLYPVWQVTFQVDVISLSISAIIALFGTALSFWILLQALTLVSPLVISVVGASEPLASILLSLAFLGLEPHWSLFVASLLILPSMVLLSIEEEKV